MNIKNSLSNSILYLLFLTTYLTIAFYIGSKVPMDFLPPSITFQNFLHLSIDDIIKLGGQGDDATYASTALTWLNTRQFNLFAINTWPPGEVFIISILVKLWGHNDYPLKMLYLSAATWSVLFALVYKSLEKLKKPLLKFLLAITPLYLCIFQNWIFNNGLVLSENLSIPLMGITACFVFMWSKSNNIKHMIGAALSLALLAYLRGLFELFGNFLCEITILYIVIMLAKTYLLNKIKAFATYNVKNIFSSTLKSIILGLVIFNIALLPWRLYRLEITDSTAWLDQGYVWAGFWQTGNIWSTGKIACDLKPQLCKIIDPDNIKNKEDILPTETYRNLTILTFITDPLEWYKIKIMNFNVFWFGTTRNDTPDNPRVNWLNFIKQYPVIFIENSAILVLGSGTLIIGLRRFRKSDKNEKCLYLFSLLFIITNAIIFTFYHYETRYSLPIQLLFTYLPIWLLCGYKNSATKGRTNVKINKTSVTDQSHKPAVMKSDEALSAN